MTKRFSNWKFPLIEEGKPNRYNWVVQNIDGLILEKYTDIGAFTYINAKYGVTIRENVQVGSHCSIYSLSTIDDQKGSVILENGCRIGTHSTILPGVRIGENSIVGAHSLVINDIPPNTLAFGIPAKVIRKL
jgi:acetyltransferase-like isoleucine patch superfamily enzyme